MNKLIVILGPTASGKTKLAAQLANSLNGEIISADSRQIYRGMDIGTGKDLDEYVINHKLIPYHLIDILDPHKNYSVYDFKIDFKKSLNIIKSNNHIPILCGGTGLYLESILLNYNISKVPPNLELREQFKDYSLDRLTKYLKMKFLNQYNKDYHISKRRIIRTIEISSSQKSNKPFSMNDNNDNFLKDSLVFGVKLERKMVLKKIKIRLLERIDNGMIREVEALINNGLSIKRLKYFGLEYKYIAQYLNKEIDLELMIEKLNYAINRFSKRQMTFYRRMEKRGICIDWIDINDFNNVKKKVNKFLQN